MKEELLELLKKYAYKKGEFTLSSGRKTDHYINCKPVTLTGRGLTLSSAILLSAVEEDCKSVGGLTLGADPLVSGIAVISALERATMDALIVRKEPKGHGTASQIEGPIPPEGSKVVVLEDVVTTGASAVKAVNVLRDAGLTVERIVTIVDRQVDGEADATVCAAQLELCSLFTLHDLVYA